MGKRAGAIALPTLKSKGGAKLFLALNLRKTLVYFSMVAYIVKLAKGIQIFGQLLHSFENIPDK